MGAATPTGGPAERPPGLQIVGGPCDLALQVPHASRAGRRPSAPCARCQSRPHRVCSRQRKRRHPNCLQTEHVARAGARTEPTPSRPPEVCFVHSSSLSRPPSAWHVRGAVASLQVSPLRTHASTDLPAVSAVVWRDALECSLASLTPLFALQEATPHGRAEMGAMGSCHTRRSGWSVEACWRGHWQIHSSEAGVTCLRMLTASWPVRIVAVRRCFITAVTPDGHVRSSVTGKGL